MTTISDIFDEVENELCRRNAEVLDSAVRLMNRCQDCCFADNVLEYRLLHHEVVKMRKIKTKITVMEDEFGCIRNSNFFGRLSWVEDRLKTIGPCSKCRLLYNPSGRSTGIFKNRQVFSPQPLYEGVIDYDPPCRTNS